MATKKLSPIAVRDQMIECFTEMHVNYLKNLKASSNPDEKGKIQEMEQMDFHEYFRRFFYEIGGNFMIPTKEDLLKVMDRCLLTAGDYYPKDEVKKRSEDMKKIINSIK